MIIRYNKEKLGMQWKNVLILSMIPDTNTFLGHYFCISNFTKQIIGKKNQVIFVLMNYIIDKINMMNMLISYTLGSEYRVVGYRHSYSEKAWACVQNGITQPGRLETWQRARRASCHVSIRQSLSCVMPFWTHAKCLLAFISYLPMWIKAKYTFIKTVYSRRFYGGPYLQVKHADVCSGVLFWTACTRRSHVLSLPSCCEHPIHDGKRGQLKSYCPKSHERYHSVVMWHWLCTNGVEATKCWVSIAHFSIYSTSRCRCHAGTDIPRLCGHTRQIGTYCQAQDFLLRTNYTLEMWWANTKSANQVPTSPVKTLVIPMSWSYRCFEWQEG